MIIRNEMPVASLGNQRPDESHIVNNRSFLPAIFFLLAIIAGLLFGNLIDFNLAFAVLLSIALLVMVLSTNLSRGWIFLLIASNLSGFFYRGSFTFRPDQVLFVWIVIVWFVYFLRNQIHLHSVPLLIPIAGYLGVNLVSSYVSSPDKAASYQGCLLLFLYLSMYVLTVNILSEKKNLIRKIPFLLVGISLAQVFYAVASMLLLLGSIQIYGASRSPIQEFGILLRGGFEEPNILAAFLMLVAIMLLAHLVAKSEWHQGMRLPIGLAVMLMVIFLTFTRAAWIGLALAAVLMVFMLRPEKNIFNPRSLAFLMVGGALVFLVALPLGNFVSGKTGGSPQLVSDRLLNSLLDFSGGSGGGRTEVETKAITRWENNPILGNGTFSFPPEESGFAMHLSWLYSSIVQSLHDTGLVGLGFLLWIYIGGLVIGIRGYLRCKSTFWKASLAGGTVGWLSMMVASQASSFIWLSFPWIFLGVLVSWAAYARELEIEAEATGNTLSRRFSSRLNAAGR